MSNRRRRKGRQLGKSPPPLKNSPHGPIQEYIESVASKSQSYESQNKSSSLVRSELHIPPTIIDHYEADQKRKNRLERWKLCIEVLALFGLFFAACIAIRQWGAMVESNHINREALISVQRAFVNSKPPIINRMVDDHSNIIGWQILPRWGNSGTTPTRIMRQHVNCEDFKDPLPSDFAFPDLKFQQNKKTVLAPKDIISTGPLTVPYAIVDEVRKGNRHFYFWGWAAYRDVFQDSNPHLTEFCYEMTAANRNIAAGGKIKFTFSGCNIHNCTDEDCPDYDQIEKKLQGE